MSKLKKLSRGILEKSSQFSLKNREERKDSLSLLHDYLYFFAIENKVIPEFPARVEFHITDKCNLSCEHCYKHTIKEKEGNGSELELSAWKGVIDECAKYGAVEIILTGGEPFIRPDVFEIVSYIKKKGIVVSITTNGLLINEEKAKRISRILKKYDHIQISVDSLKKNSIRHCDMNLVKHNIETLVKHNVPVFINMVITRLNYKEMLDVYMFCQKTGVKGISYSPLFEVKSNKHLSIADETEVLIEENKLLKYAERTKFKVPILQGGIGVNYPFWNILEKKHSVPIVSPRFICPAGIVHVCISSTGKVFPCPYLIVDKFVIGNIQQNTLHYLWNNSDKKWKSLRKRIMEKPERAISSCPLVGSCNGSCAAQSYHSYGSIHQCDSRCFFVKNPEMMKEI